MVTAACKLLAFQWMRVIASLLLCCAWGTAQPVPPGLIRGTLEHAVGADKEFQVRTRAGTLYVFRFDAKTWIERDGNRVPGASLDAGETLEVVCDREITPVHYARTIHVGTGIGAARNRMHRTAPPTETVTISGLVIRLDRETVSVRTRDNTVRVMKLLSDTTYLDNGDSVEANQLHPNARVFIRAGTNAAGSLEAYTIVWGEILTVP